MSFDEKLRARIRAEETPTPRDFSDRVEQTLEELPARPGGRRGHWRQALLSLAAVMVLVVALPNVNAAMAEAMGSLPVVGPLFQAVTFRTYEVSEGRNRVSIQVPQVLDEAEGSGAEEINRQVEDYTNQLIEAYENELHADGYFNLEVSWEVVTDTDRWFTLKLNTDLVLASGNHQERYYHIDKATGEQKTLSDLFPADYDYVTAISEELKSQMLARMEADSREVYWLEGRDQLGSYFFDAIDPEQNFYFDEEGRLTIPFNKYEVGPGSTGSPRFALETPELYEQMLYRP